MASSKSSFSFKGPLFLSALLLVLLGGAGLYVNVILEEDVSWAALWSIFGFYAVIFFLGALAGQKEKSKDPSEAILAGRSLPLVLSIFTMSATWVGGGYVNGTAEYTASSGLAWVQAPWGYALSLILGGLFFAGVMRKHEFTTMLDPFEERYGKELAGLFYLPALLGEIFWTAAILTALGTTFGTILGIDFSSAIIISAVIVISYTALGGLWAVAVTDVIQLLLLIVGLWIVVPLSLEQVGSLSELWSQYSEKKGSLAYPFPPLGGWDHPQWKGSYWIWWDTAFLLIFGGIPWHVYFQRVLSAKNSKVAVRLSIFAGFVCLFAAIPAVLIGMISDVAPWNELGLEAPKNASLTLPYVLQYLTSPWVAIIGLGGLAAAVMSSVDSSILSASSLTAWNVYRPLINPKASSEKLFKVIQKTTWVIGISATLFALKIKSVYALWFLCSDFVYTILFPQLVTVIYFKKATKKGALAGFVVSLSLRLSAGEELLGIPAIFDWEWIKFKTVAMLGGLITIFVVSYLTHPKNKEPLPRWFTTIT
jgi:high affinity choline transporter 7